MKKKLLKLLTIPALSIMLFTGCGSSSSSQNNSNENLKISMVTGTGTIDDKSFNQGTWEGLLAIQEELGLSEPKYLQPTGETESDYIKEFNNLSDGGYNFIAAPGFKFETAIYKAQEKFPNIKFLITDGQPTDENGNVKIADNTVAVTFAEEQAGFVAAISAALEIKTGDFGFIGGMQSPAVQRFCSGYKQGIEYANKSLGTNISLKEENIVYQGTFTDVAAGQQIAAQMYNKGVNVIFAAAGSVGNGVINEAKNRINNGESVWVIGVDRDQYADGIYSDDNSVILTSAIKKVDSASYNIVKQIYDGEFPGGQNLVFDISQNAVGIPQENPNLSADTITKVNEIIEQMKNGTITVSSEV